MEIENFETAVVPQCKVVAEASIARKLLKDGYKVVDIKPKRNHERESIFLFEVVPGFMETMNKYIDEKKNRVKSKEE